MSGSDAGGSAPPRLIEAIRDSGLVEPGSSGIVMLSGGPDSICLLAGLAGFGLERSGRAPPELRARATSPMTTRPSAKPPARSSGWSWSSSGPGQPEGNVQNWARELRYAAAEELRAERGADWIAVGHTQDDVAETVIYRLASSPGRRAAAAMKPASGRIVRPLLGLTRAETRALATESGLGFRR